MVGKSLVCLGLATFSWSLYTCIRFHNWLLYAGLLKRQNHRIFNNGVPRIVSYLEMYLRVLVGKFFVLAA
jgi:hypothetical protein